MIEYPVLIADKENALTIRTAVVGESTVFDWDLRYVAEGSYQLRITSNGEVIQNRNITLGMIFNESSLPTTQGNFYVSQAPGYVQMADVLPTPEVLKLLLRVFVYSNPYYTDGRDLDFCEEDECAAPMPLHNDGEHSECATCETPHASQLMAQYYVNNGRSETTMYICNGCTSQGYTITDIDDVATCTICTDFWEVDELGWTNILGQGEVLVCTECSDDFYMCIECEALGDLDNMTRDDDGDVFCNDCFPDNNDQFVEGWNYLPELIFHPTLPKDPLKPLYIGMEIEIQWDNWRYEDTAGDWIVNVKNKHEDIMFVKSDSSINDGFELVTHPMSPEWALENFPFEVLEDAVDGGANVSHPSCGIHIHIDRGALSTAQLWKILKVHSKQRELCGIIGGRGTTSTYASWDNDYDCVGEKAMEIARAKGEAWGGSDRYTPINLKNENTIELRYMEGSIAVTDLKKNIEWVQALYDFTDHISVEDVKNGVLDIPGFLLGWIVDQEKIYPNLTGFVLKRTMIPLEMPTRSASCV